jgi:hypothetical protein
MKIYVTSMKGKWVVVTPHIPFALRIWDIVQKIGGKFIDVDIEMEGVKPGVFIIDKLPVEFSKYYVALAPNHPVLQDLKLKKAIEEL